MNFDNDHLGHADTVGGAVRPSFAGRLANEFKCDNFVLGTELSANVRRGGGVGKFRGFNQRGTSRDFRRQRADKESPALWDDTTLTRFAAMVEICLLRT